MNVFSQTWVNVGTGLGAACIALKSFGGELYAGGYLVSASHAASWNGTIWTPRAANMNGVIAALEEHSNSLFAGGAFDSADGNAVNFIAGFNSPSSWVSISSTGADAPVETLESFGGELWIGGDFTWFDGLNPGPLAHGNIGGWSSVGNAFNGQVYSLKDCYGQLYAGGSLAWTNLSGNVGKWNGTSWDLVSSTSMGELWNGFVSSIAGYNGEVYAAGDFTIADSIYANRIARWNGTTWNPIGSGVDGLNDLVRCMIAFNNELYAGGNFTMAGGIPANHIAKWNGTNWSAVGLGMNGEVMGMEVYNGDLYACGFFTTAGGNPANYIARLVLANSVIENDNGGTFSLSPNPATNQLTIDNGELQIETVEVYDVLGQLQHSTFDIQHSSFTLDVSSLSPGIYFVKIKTNEGEKAAKFVKE